MYIPDIYKNEDQEDIKNFIHHNGFGIIINKTNGKLWATHIPLVLDKNKLNNDILIGHVSLENPQGQNLKNGDEILAVFSGPHSYISSSWYDHENVPTWNYIAVHVYGKIELHDHNKAIESLKKLVNKYEEKSENPVRIENLSEKTMRQARGIISFEIEISSIESVKKLSQNRDSTNYQKIIKELEKTNDIHSHQVAQAMVQNRANK